MARKLALTNVVIADIEKYLNEGNTKKTAAICSGIGERTFYDWLTRAEKAEQKNEEEWTDEDKLYMQFSQAVEKGIEEAKRRNLLNIQRVAQGSVRHTKEYTDANGEEVVEKDYNPPNWQASAWMLERRHPEEFALRGRVDINRNENINHNINVTEDVVVKVELSEERAERVAGIIHDLIPLPAGKRANGSAEVE